MLSVISVILKKGGRTGKLANCLIKTYVQQLEVIHLIFRVGASRNISTQEKAVTKSTKLQRNQLVIAHCSVLGSKLLDTFQSSYGPFSLRICTLTEISAFKAKIQLGYLCWKYLDE